MSTWRAPVAASRTSVRRYVWLSVAAFAHVGLAELAAGWFVPSAAARFITPLSASGLLICLLWGFRYWPVPFGVALLVGLVSAIWQSGFSYHVLALAILLASALTAHAVLGALLVRAIAGLRKPLMASGAKPHRGPRKLGVEVIKQPIVRPDSARSALKMSELDRVRLDALISERTAEVDSARKVAEDANRAKTLFLANMSHELRTPMHAVLSYAQLGHDAGSIQEQRDYFERIAERGHALLGLLSDLLDLSRLESGSMNMEYAPHDLEALLRDALQQMQPVFLAKSVSSEFKRTPDCASARVRVDSVRIGQLLVNLLANAVRFSPVGGCIRVQLSRAVLPPAAGASGAALPRTAVEIAISDDGVGIPEAELESIFDKFVQSSKTRTNAGGTGLGLSICRQIATLHAGAVTAANNSGPGATVRVVLPLAVSIFAERGAA